MRIFRSPFDAGRAFPGSVVVIGKFDALHRGHRRLLKAAARRAKELAAPLAVLSFDPSPERYLGLPEERPVLSVVERVELLRELGVDALVLLPFDRDIACLSPAAFSRDVLAGQLKPSVVCVGEDFCYGRDRAGRVHNLEEQGRRLGFRVLPVPLLLAGGRKISATRVRRLLESGRRAEAEKLLGRKLSH